MSARLVFVPLFGDSTGCEEGETAQWQNLPHVKAWGIDDGEEFEVLFTDPPAYRIGDRVVPFDAETKQMVEITDDTTLPDEVCVALAMRALINPPVRED